MVIHTQTAPTPPPPTASPPFCCYWEAIWCGGGDIIPVFCQDIVFCAPGFLSQNRPQTRDSPSNRHTPQLKPQKRPGTGFQYASTADSNGVTRPYIKPSSVSVPVLFSPRVGRLEAAHIGPRLHNEHWDDATTAAIDARHKVNEKVSCGRRGAYWPTKTRAAPDVALWWVAGTRPPTFWTVYCPKNIVDTPTAGPASFS